MRKYGWIGNCTVLLSAFFFTSSCAASRVMETLPESVQQYNNDIRWQRWQAASQRVTKDQKMAFLEGYQSVDSDLRIQDHTVLRTAYDEKLSRANVFVRYQWYLDSKATLHTTEVLQRWVKMPGAWVVERQKTIKGPEIPGNVLLPPIALTDNPCDRNIDDIGSEGTQ